MRELRFFADEIAKRYGHPLRRIPLSAGFSCPNRDSRGRGGCLFCAEDGSRAGHLREGMSLEEQVRSGLALAQRLYDAKPPWIAYFQAFTATNAPAEKIRAMLEETVRLADFPVIVLATRPDCLPDPVLDLLEEWNRKVELWVELGVQTAQDKTLRRIRRGHDFACSENAVRHLHERGIRTAAHLILGLPGETPEDMMDTADKIAKLPFSAVKMHHLLILKGTGLAKTPCPCLNEYEYAILLRDFLHRLPDGMLLMRLSSDAPEDTILAPKWWMNKSQFLNFFRSLWSASGDGVKYLPLRTGDGSYTLYHPAYRQYFHSVSGAKTESGKKYLEPLKIRERLRAGRPVRILEIGFGLGFNAGEICRTAETEAKGRASVTSLESDLQVLQAARTLPDHHAPEMIRDLAEKGVYSSPFAQVRILAGDARKTLPGLSGPFDFIFLDGFSPDSNPELWTADLILRMKEKLTPGGAVVCYSSAYPVAGAFLEAGFDLRITEPFGRKRFGLAAFLPPADTDLAPFPEKERAITLKSTAGTPYRDPELNRSRDEIKKARGEEVLRLRASGVPKWYRSSGF